jgi:hypothetical protein
MIKLLSNIYYLDFIYIDSYFEEAGLYHILVGRDFILQKP